MTITRFVSFKRSLAAAGATVLIGASAFGIAHAQQTPTPTPGSVSPTPTPAAHAQRGARIEQFLDTLAAKLGVTPEKLKQAIQETRQQLGYGPGRHQGHKGGLPFGGRAGLPGLKAELSVAAQAIGITPDQLRQELPGKSLSDVAKAHNVDPSKVANAIKADANAKIDQLASRRNLSADQVAQLKQRAAALIDRLMARQFPAKVAPGARGNGSRSPAARSASQGQA
jgi:hypothetical protein